MPGMVIRHARRDELDRLLALLEKKARFDGALDQLRTTERSLDGALSGSPRAMEALVADVAGTLAGFATCFRTHSSFLGRPGLWLDDLYVDAGHRRAGIGSALLRAVCRMAADAGCARVDWVVHRDNADAIAFYRRHGAIVHEDLRPARLEEDRILRIANDDGNVKPRSVQGD